MNSNFTNSDIINGRGQGRQRHPGNVMFRKLVNAHKQIYARAPIQDKQNISRGIVTALRQFGARFLEFDAKTGCYLEIGDMAVAKTSQALRVGQKNIKQELASGKMDDSYSSMSSTNTSSEESCVNYSILLLQSLSEEEAASRQQQQETQEQETRDVVHLPMPRPPLLPYQPSISEGEVHSILKKVGVEEVGLSEREISFQFRDISEVVSKQIWNDVQTAIATDILDEPEMSHSSANGFDLSDMDVMSNEEAADVIQELRFDFSESVMDRFSFMSLDDDGNVEAVLYNK